jgi:hypothetical protein
MDDETVKTKKHKKSQEKKWHLNISNESEECLKDSLKKMKEEIADLRKKEIERERERVRRVKEKV